MRNEATNRRCTLALDITASSLTVVVCLAVLGFLIQTRLTAQRTVGGGWAKGMAAPSVPGVSNRVAMAERNPRRGDSEHSRHPMHGISGALLETQKELTGVDGSARRHADLPDHAALGRANLILHLHGFQHQQALIVSDRLPFFD